jgi:hypothetical protein
MTKRCIPLCRLADNGSITFWERKRSSTQTTNPIVHTNTREVAERSPSKVVHIYATVSFEHQVQEG